MKSETQTSSVSRKMYWAGHITSGVIVLALVFSAAMKLMKPPEVVEGFVRFGFAESLILSIGILEIVCTVLYVIPQTAVLGAILLTGYLGGATVTHLRMGEPFSAPIICGVLVWAGLFLRDPRIRALIPFRRKPTL